MPCHTIKLEIRHIPCSMYMASLTLPVKKKMITLMNKRKHDCIFKKVHSKQKVNHDKTVKVWHTQILGKQDNREGRKSSNRHFLSL